jgi:hypothetical protein
LEAFIDRLAVALKRRLPVFGIVLIFLLTWPVAAGLLPFQVP